MGTCVYIKGAYSVVVCTFNKKAVAMYRDETCIKSDVCDMAVCDGAECNHRASTGEGAKTSNNSAMVPCPKWHLGGKCWGDPWKEVCPAQPCCVSQREVIARDSATAEKAEAETQQATGKGTPCHFCGEPSVRSGEYPMCQSCIDDTV